MPKPASPSRGQIVNSLPRKRPVGTLRGVRRKELCPAHFRPGPPAPRAASLLHCCASTCGGCRPVSVRDVPERPEGCATQSPGRRGGWGAMGGFEGSGVAGTRAWKPAVRSEQRATAGRGAQPRAPPWAAPRTKLLTWWRRLLSQLVPLGSFLGLGCLLGRPRLGRARLPLPVPGPRGQRRRKGLGLGLPARVVGLPAPGLLHVVVRGREGCALGAHPGQDHRQQREGQCQRGGPPAGHARSAPRPGQGHGRRERRAGGGRGRLRGAGAPGRQRGARGAGGGRPAARVTGPRGWAGLGWAGPGRGRAGARRGAGRAQGAGPALPSALPLRADPAEAGPGRQVLGPPSSRRPSPTLAPSRCPDAGRVSCPAGRLLPQSLKGVSTREEARAGSQVGEARPAPRKDLPNALKPIRGGT